MVSRGERPAAPAGGGFTLLEVLVALSIIATALVGLLGLHNRNIRLVAADRDLGRATLLAEELLQRTLEESPFPDPGEGDGEFPHAPGFRWQVSVVPGRIPGTEEELREVRLRVFWDPSDPDAVRLVAFVRKPDV